MGDVRDAVGLEHQPRTQLPFGARDLLVGEPLFHNRVDARRARRPRASGSVDALHGGQRNRCRETDPPSPRAIRQRTMRGRARRGWCRAAPCAAAERRESSTTDSCPWRRSAPRRARASGRNPDRSTAGARQASFKYAVVPSRSMRTRRSPICAGSIERVARSERLPPESSPKCASAAPEHIVGIDVTDDDERRVVGDVVPPVVAVQIVATHRPQIVDPADRGMAIRSALGTPSP